MTLSLFAELLRHYRAESEANLPSGFGPAESREYVVESSAQFRVIPEIVSIFGTAGDWLHPRETTEESPERIPGDSRGWRLRWTMVPLN